MHPGSQFLIGGETGPGFTTGAATGITPGTAAQRTRIPLHVGYDDMVGARGAGGSGSEGAPLGKPQPQVILTEENFRGPG